MTIIAVIGVSLVMASTTELKWFSNERRLPSPVSESTYTSSVSACVCFVKESKVLCKFITILLMALVTVRSSRATGISSFNVKRLRVTKCAWFSTAFKGLNTARSIKYATASDATNNNKEP